MDPVTRAYREQNLALRAATIQDLQRLWPALRYDQLAETFPTWFTAVSSTIKDGRIQAADLAAQYLRDHRAQVGIRGEPVIDLVTEIAAGQMQASMLVTSLVAVKQSTAAGKAPQQAMTDAFVMSSGAATRLILDAGRDTVRMSSIADPRIAGWKRVGVGRCEFCRMLLGRGAVYSEATAYFQSHDHCTCSAEPEYR